MLPRSRTQVVRAERAGVAKRVRSRFRVTASALALAVGLPGAVIGGVVVARAAGDREVTLQAGRSWSSPDLAGLGTARGGATFELAGPPAGSSLYVGVELRRTVDGSLYRAKARINPDGTVSVDVGKVVAGGAEQFLGSSRVPATVAAGTALSVEAAVNGGASSTVAVRAWVAGTPVPKAQLTVTDPSAVQGGGRSRAWAYLSRAATGASFFTPSALDTVAGPEPAATGTATTTAVPTVAPAPSRTPSATPTGSGDPRPDPAVSAGMRGVLARSGAAATTHYAVPSRAITVPAGGDIAAAIRRAPAGGTVVLKGGTYRQAVGSVGKRITLQAAPGEHPVISGLGVVTDWTRSGDAWRSGWASPFGQNQFRPDETPAGTSAGKVEQAYRDGTALTQVPNRNQVRTGTFWVDPASRHLYVGADPAGATMEVATRERALTLEPGAAGSKILGLRFTGFASPHLDNGAMLYVGSPRTLIQNSTFDHSSGAGLKLAAENLTVDAITAAQNAAEGMTGNRAHHSVIRNSRFMRNNTDRFLSEGCKMSCTVAGFKTAHTDGMTVKDNAFVDNVANGFWCDLGCTDTTITGNAVTGSYDGIFYEVSSRATIAGNYVEDSDKGIRISGSDHVRLLNNRLHNNKWQLTLYDDGRSPSTDAYSAQQGLSWNTTDVVIEGTKITGGPRTEKLLETNARQVNAAQMLNRVSGNSNRGNQVVLWCAPACRTFDSVGAWQAASGKGF